MKRYLLTTFLFATLSYNISALARHDLADKLESEGQIMTLEDILNIVNKELNGRILEAELEMRKGQYIYQLDLLDSDGVVWEVEYDASSGKLITKERD